MSETAVFSPEEQKYFETRGEAAIQPEPPPQEPPPAPPGGADEVPKAADVPAEDETNVEEGKADPDNPGKFVRLGALHEERQRRKELAEELARTREQSAADRARLEERLNAIAQSFKQPEQPPKPLEPAERLARLEQELQQRAQVEQQQRAAYEAQQRFNNDVRSFENKFAAANQDYYDAVEFAKDVRRQDYLKLGLDADTAEELVMNDAQKLALDSLRRGIDPAERFYNYAKANGWGAPKEPEKPAAPPEDAAAKLKTIEAGQKAAKSLGAAPGSSQPALTLQALADMSDEDFAKIDAKTWKKMMGG